MGTPKKKLCWNCEGRVTLTEEYCPFCGVYLSPSTVPEGADPSHHLSPPYKLVEEEVKSATDRQDHDQEENTDDQSPQNQEKDEEFKSLCITISSLLSGVVFFIFGLVLFMFSHQGIFSLQWNAHYWYIYLLASLPLLFMGWVKFKALAD